MDCVTDVIQGENQTEGQGYVNLEIKTEKCSNMDMVLNTIYTSLPRCDAEATTFEEIFSFLKANVFMIMLISLSVLALLVIFLSFMWIKSNKG